MFLFLVIFNFFLAINTYSNTKSFVTLNEDINLRSLEDEKEPTKGSQKFFCVTTPAEAIPSKDTYYCDDTLQNETYQRCECHKDYANNRNNATAVGMKEKNS